MSRGERLMAAPSYLRETLPLPLPTVARQTPNHVHTQENHRNRCAGHEREVAPRMRRLGVVAVIEIVHHCGGSFETTPSGVTLCPPSYPRSPARLQFQQLSSEWCRANIVLDMVSFVVRVTI